MNLAELGWNERFESGFSSHREQGCVPLRVVKAAGGIYTLLGPEGERTARVAGRLKHQAEDETALPAVGDWVAATPLPEGAQAVIEAVLPRSSALVRQAAGSRKGRGTPSGQVLAANVDTVLIVTGLDRDFNLRRIERYLTLVSASGASPVILLNKADLCPDLEERLAEVLAIAPEVPVHTLSARQGQGLEALQPLLKAGQTLVLVGSSGAGKSTLVNRLLGEERQKVGTVSKSVGKGRHTTTHRELLPLPDGGVIIDTPGLRELQLWGEGDALQGAFQEIEALAGKCRFRNCRHVDEPGCAVQAALAAADLDPLRLESFLKQRDELENLALRQDLGSQVAQKKKWKSIHRERKRWKKDIED